MRSSLADEAIYGGAHYTALWNKFADRGFGFYAGSDDGNDAGTGGRLQHAASAGDADGQDRLGTVTDKSGNPLQGAVVKVAGHSEYSDTSDANGEYKIDGVRGGDLAEGGRLQRRLRARLRRRHRDRWGPGGLRPVAPARLGVGQRWRQHRQLHRSRLLTGMRS